ncbi:MAG TPA: ATP-binding protein, partial [Pyrinomonadaceae bacterium]|nr:ATP-binding protein [Pyrinomonadaceae bacterium]
NTHDLFRTTTQAIDLALIQAPGDQRELKDLDAQIRRSFLSVEKELLDLRMVSAGPVLKRAARAGRAAARLSNKKVDFRITGEDLRLDRLLCDTIRDPLIHLVRNAVDHGAAFGASEAEERKHAQVLIEAINEGGQTCVRVTDNGRGVDPELVYQAARQMGIIDETTRVDLERSLRLIFRPGFTTLSSVSSVSGRGVGLDIVETAVEQAGGQVRVRSELGKGATFEMRLPVTVALMQATIVLVGGRAYCIDSDQVIEGVNDEMPLIRLEDLLGQERSGRRDDLMQVVTCEILQSNNSQKRVGLIVDAVQGTEEILVRSLGRHAARWTGIAGATELRDGTVALVLDLPRLLEPAEQAKA